jgi:methyl-accepting chemotaxis protein
MAEVELKKLKRSEILELMIRQADEVRALRRAMEEHEAQYQEQLEAQQDTIARLRAGFGIAEEDSAESRQMDQVYKQIEQKMRRYRARIKELETEVDELKQMIQDGEWE